ncbi:flavin-dependent oxidoreductase [Actinomadura kijaniata]|uniref:2-polyprenyl-6-methoxyphenol hydroxylase-like FAD-dependent oxidoreductase n=1 Tax=Actinomadura namibiensis TaxID=182080 RepID=A0A7W3QM65_ACTNM|nr:flavin-dependent oxidoreductase [Actinomadura namibiensis]MBA8952240.1 2-polyprenyl-6-methoxyphenol hydroxylase-like FAD-dependent oxidoreductase [Actinomadura namibiensis]
MRVLIAGAGIGGLTAALSLRAAGLDARIVDSARELRPLGVGINLLPHAVRELTELGLGDALAATGLPAEELVHFDRHGNRVWGQARGRRLGHRHPQYFVHRGELQMVLLAAVRERLGADAVRTGTAVTGFEDTGTGVRVRLRDQATGAEREETADVLVGADGLHSAVRRALHPGEGGPLWNGVRLWRGVTEADPFLTGRTMAVLGTRFRAKFICYPVSREADGRGRALVNWLGEVQEPTTELTEIADWDRTGRLADVLPYFADWKVPWLDVPGLIRGADRILEYPMVDRDPLPFWSRGRVTLLGDAAHPMYPLGSNGGSQAVVDARVLAWELARADGPVEGLAAYDAARREEVNAIVLANRTNPGDAILDAVAERAPDGFDRIEDVLTPEELVPLEGGYRQITHTDAVDGDSPWTVRPDGVTSGV